MQAIDTDWEWATGKGLSAVSGVWAVGRTVAAAVKRALGQKESARPLPVEPVLNGRTVLADNKPDSWESLSAFIRSGGQYRATTLLRGGREREETGVLTGGKLTSEPNWADVDASSNTKMSFTVPAETLERLHERELQAPSDQARTAVVARQIPPPAHPPPHDAGNQEA